MVAVLAIRVLNTVVVRAPRRARVSCGALRAHCPIAANERAPASTPEQAMSSTPTNG
ncbi:hypothetical protein GCM10022207_32820 [Streptomyces lannensis]|uniref:Uncharacterized protein n=1 Tax=Streptomyces lannensis TaxID=766498 RepID=A0ABP7K4Y6_9ACTN